MRLLSLTLRSYRTHKDLTIRFDSSRNLIGGPNESGKSTIAEAIHRALFLRSKTGGNLREEMRSTRHGGEPEIDLVFEACDSRWTLEKRFSGSKGSTRLTDTAGNVRKDDEAEAKLAEILKCDTNGGRLSANQLSAIWSHLWVWQGSSGTDPSGHTSDHKDTLVQRLQHDGLAAVMQSATDQRVREKITAAYDELFTSRGPKAGSKPEIARVQLAEAEAAFQRARETTARLEQAAADYQQAEREIAEVDATLPSLKTQKAATEERLTEVGNLQREEATHRQLWETAATHLRQLTEQDTAIRKLKEQALSARDALAPAERMEASLLTEEQRAAELSQAAETAQRESGDAVRLTRMQHDFAAASITSFEKAAQHRQLSDRAEQAARLRGEISAHQESLSKLPALTPRDLDSLRQLDRAASQAAASLAAIATGIELLSADGAVTLDGKQLAPGESRTLTDAGELVIGPGTRIRIHPGGGTSLADARSLQESSQRNLTAALDRHTLRDLDHATAILQQRQTLAQQIAQLEGQWKALGGESLATELATATSALEATKSEVQRRLEVIDPAPPVPENLEAAMRLRARLQQELHVAEEAEARARHRSTQHRQRLETATANLRNHREQTSQARQSLRDLETRLQVLEESHGEAAAREAALNDATARGKQTAEQLAATSGRLTALAPDLLAADLDRFTRSITQQEGRRRDAENSRLVSRDRLILDGTTDPHAELALAESRRDTALELHYSEQRRAKAIEHLHQLFSSSREAIDRSIIQPLADRISGYLQCLFGPAAQIRVNLSDTGIEGFDLIRPGDPVFSFATLSGGTKEQVAAAARLAMAEILATDHNGSLPILFDDAFAYTDPDRVQSLQRMLDLAANRGLQIIVLTCTPADYSALGAAASRIVSE
jgi:DNA repair exonuclease SbcCD ATPase subunit